MAARSAGILLYRVRNGTPEVLLVHPGGPFFARKDAGVWSIPKGEYSQSEDPRACALGQPPPSSPLTDLGEIRQAGGKLVRAWAVEGDFDPSTIHSNSFSLEWPPKSGRIQEFPEVDRAEWFSVEEARDRILPGQRPLLDRLAEELASHPPGAAPER